MRHEEAAEDGESTVRPRLRVVSGGDARPRPIPDTRPTAPRGWLYLSLVSVAATAMTGLAYGLAAHAFQTRYGFTPAAAFLEACAFVVAAGCSGLAGMIVRDLRRPVRTADYRPKGDASRK
jgi:hypothetical protein